jgi:acyl-coenzyme A thioesterase PaaI-like protein
MRTNSSAQPSQSNQFNRLNARLGALPLPRRWRQQALTLGMRWTIPYLSTSSIELIEFSPASARLSVRNRRKVQNHMGSVHASAMYLLAEAATGTVVAANLPDRSRYSVTHSEVDYVRRAVGDLVAHASLDEAQQQALREQPKGRLKIPVQVLDQEGNEPAHFTIEWAWKHPDSEAR